MKRAVTYRLYKKTKTGIINTSLSFVLLASSIGGALPLFLSQKAYAAATISVCASGCDQSTIAGAIAAASTGDTISVGAGNYDGSNINVNKPVSIVGVPGAVVNVPNVNNTNGFDVWANDVSITGLTIVGPADGTSYLTYAWGGTVTRGIAVHNGVTNFNISDNTIKGLRNNVLIDGRNTGLLTNNVIDNSKSGVSVQYTDAGTGNSEGYSVTMSGNHDDVFGNEWGVNAHLNGHFVGATYFNNSQKIATDAPGVVQQDLLDNSAANGGWTVQDQGYTNHNRTAVSVATSGSDSNQGSPLGPLANLQTGVTAVVTDGTVNLESAMTVSAQVTINKQLTLNGNGNTLSPSFTKTSNSNNSALGILADNVTVNNLVENGTNGIDLHGINVFDSVGVNLNNVTVTDNDRTGLNVNASNVTVSNLTTGNNGWHGVDVDKVGAILTVNGTSHHTEVGPDVYVDNTTVGQVVDTNNQYASKDNVLVAGDRVYDLKLAAPTLVFPANNGYTTTNNFYFEWDDVAGASGYEFQNSLTGGTNPNGSLSSVHYSAATTESRLHSTGAPNGTVRYWQVRAVDSLGVPGAWSAPWKMTIDMTAPATPTLLTPPNNSFVATNDFYFTWTASSDANPVTYEFQSSQNSHTTGGVLDTGVWNNIANGNSEQNNLTDPKIHSTGAPDGDWYWQVRAIDAAGNKSAWTSVWKVTIDTNTPAVPANLSWKTTTNVTVANGGSTNVLGGTASWQGSGDVDHYVYKYWNDIPGNQYKVGSEYTANVGGTSLAGVFNQGEGVHHFCVQAVDAAGNTSACSAPFTITYDITKPVVNLTTPAANAVNPSSLSVNATDNIALNKVTANIYDETNTVLKKSCSATATPAGTDNYVLNCPISGLADGTYTIRYNANDRAGNVSTTKTSKFVLDTTAPTGLANVSPADGTVTTTAAQQLITWTAASDTNGPISYYYESSTSSATNPDGSFVSPAYQSGALSDHQIPTPGTPAGTYFWHVRAVDAAGNSTAWTDAWTIVIDNTAPVVTVNTLSTTDTTPTVTGTVDDNTATVEVVVNGNTYTATVTGNTWSADVTNAVAVGSYDVVATATDAAGNAGTDSTSNELTITAPAVLGSTTTNNVVVTSNSNQNANTGNANNSGNGSGGDALSGDATNTNDTNISASVLGASTDAEGDDSEVKTFANAAAEGNKFLGLGYWWLLVLAVVAGFWLLIAAVKRRSDENEA